jgi:hypothetical protein
VQILIKFDQFCLFFLILRRLWKLLVNDGDRSRADADCNGVYMPDFRN